MAIKKKKKKARGNLNPAQDVLNKHVKNMPSVAMGDLAEKNIVDYGSYTIYSRAIPMLYDGMKPVHRRIGYTMLKMGLLNNVSHRKSAKIVGDTMGTYHPHGDASIYGAMVKLSTGNGSSPNAMVDGQGNWGDFDGTGPAYGAAAYRYTEARLTKLASTVLVPKEYMDKEVIPYVPNFDGSTEEPLYLPSLLPTIFLLGADGIATGVAVSMPAYTYESVVAATKTLFKTKSGKKASAKLVPVQKWGAQLVSGQAELDSYHATGQGKLTWQAPYTVDRKATTTVVRLTGLPPTKYETLVASLLGNEKKGGLKGVGFFNLASKKTGLLFEIHLKDEAVLPTVKKKLVVSESYNSAVTLLVASNDPEAPLKVAFEAWSPNTILEKWLEWRVELEKRLIKSLIRDNAELIRRKNLMVLAANKLDIIFEILKSKSGDKVAMIEKRLKVTNEEAKEIWQMAIRQLDKLNADETKAEIVALEKANKKLKAEYKEPADRILAKLNELPLDDPNAKKRKG